VQFPGAFRNTVKGYRAWARRQGDPWELTEDECRTIMALPCRYCGVPPSNVARRGKPSEFRYQGMDRVEAARGYVKGNVVPCCKKCNWAKQRMGVIEFRNWVTAVFQHFCAGGL
jgi:hypothetical protein